MPLIGLPWFVPLHLSQLGLVPFAGIEDLDHLAGQLPSFA